MHFSKSVFAYKDFANNNLHSLVSTVSPITKVTMSKIQVILHLMKMVSMTHCEPILVSTLTGDQEDTCSVYPLCSEDYGEGRHEILEDCQKFFECKINVDGTYTQRNMMCEDNLVYTDKLGGCGDPAQAPECQQFENLKCKLECPRIYFTSLGISSSSQPEALGCYRLKGSKDLNRVAYYENSNKLTLTPYPANIWVSWYITANTKCPYSGLLVNERDRYVRCPRSQWRGWDVRTGGGLVQDEDINTTCLSGDEEIQPSTTTTSTITSTTTITASTTTLTTTSTSTTTTTVTTTTTTTTTTTSTTTTSTSTTTTTINPELEGKQKVFNIDIYS